MNIHDCHDSVVNERYASYLSFGSKLSFFILLICFSFYLTGLLPANIPLETMSSYWNLSLADFIAKTNHPTGLDWLTRIGDGEYASLLGTSLLASCSIPCLAASSVLYLRKGDTVYARLCCIQIVILISAASGML